MGKAQQAKDNQRTSIKTRRRKRDEVIQVIIKKADHWRPRSIKKKEKKKKQKTLLSENI